MAATKTVYTTCTRNCPNTCGLHAVVERSPAGERLIKLVGAPEHPYTRGHACMKTARYVRRVYDPERVRRPLIRKDGLWKRASWEEVLDRIALRMQKIVAEDGPEAVFYYQGFGERTGLKLLNRLFFNHLGGATFLRGTVCGGTGQASQNLDVGERVSHDPLDHYNSNSMILWGRNPVSTNISLCAVIADIRKRGGKVALVDPVPTRTAALADRHIAPRPGSDAFLALDLAGRILQSGKADLDFMRAHTEGCDGYLALVKRFSREQLERYHDVPREDADFLADMLLHHKPTSVLLGWGLHRHEHAHYAIRAIDALGALAGILGVPGGGVSQGFEEYGPYDQQYWGDHLNPPRRSFLMPAVGKEILAARNPPVRMIVVGASNPVCMAPDSAGVAEALRRTELVVYIGHFLDDTAECSSIFLPATTFLEEDDVVASYGHNYVGGVNRAIEPLGECRSEFDIFQDLARRFPFSPAYCRPLADWLRDVCAPMLAQGCRLEDLKRGPFRLNAPMVPYSGGIFPTPSGKFRCLTDLDTSFMRRQDAEHAYFLLSVAPHAFLCSERNAREHSPLPPAGLSQAEAERLGLRDGDLVRLENGAGSVTAKLTVVEGQRPDIVVVERGGWIKCGHGLNLLTSPVPSRVGDGTPYYDARVAVRPFSEDGGAPLRLLVLENHEVAPGGVFCKTLARQGALLDVLHPQHEALPADSGDYAALVALGGPQDAYDDAASPFLRAEMDLMRAFAAAGKPVAGICLGAQLLARAHGGAVAPMEFPEFGFTRLSLTPEGREDPVLGLRASLPLLMEYHQDAFTLPPGGVLLVRGEACANQMFRVGACSYGFQFHLEAEAGTMEEWIREMREGRSYVYAKLKDRLDGSRLDAWLEDLPALSGDSALFGARIAENWLKLACAGRQTGTP
ncbi:MAG: molybdopterin-dependent oxidoreductase [Desulfovibrio sp.]|jgi:anaerobic selenocysteine-containing dehydrogenase/GMP synthase-like glutamine amidotransferase|nr:molybdopterin-dependent oxidoreductase [Desulfovibrio sp.]